jgi:hypothetical protein
MQQQPPSNELSIELSEEMAEGIYANLTIISHFHTEFFLDFVRLVPNLNKAKVKSRIVLSPQHAKRLMNALRENIKRYESLHGLIPEDNQPTLPMNFNAKGQA